MNTAILNNSSAAQQRVRTALESVRRTDLTTLIQLGIPTSKNEEWKYTRIAGLFNKEYRFCRNDRHGFRLIQQQLDAVRLPGHEQANELIFVNGVFSFELSVIRSSALRGFAIGRSRTNEYADMWLLQPWSQCQIFKRWYQCT